ncbi:MAG: hypothetical protein PVH03_10325 [Chloroflexota bacterium]|jgi:hypothetical protein
MGSKLAELFALPMLLLVAISVFPQGVRAQSQNGIVNPAPGDIISGIVLIEGTAIHPDFLRYEIAFKQDFNPAGDWIVFAQGDRPVVDDTLAVWDTTVGGEAAPVFPDGRYRLRLRVVRNDYNYDEFFVTDLIIANSNLTPTVTPTITPTLSSGVETPLSSTVVAATLQAETGILPTLTPFPTPSRMVTPVDSPLGPAAPRGGSSDEGGGLLDQLAGINFGLFGRAFWFGVTIVAYAFVGLAIYLLLRALLRWIRRRIRISGDR